MLYDAALQHSLTHGRLLAAEAQDAALRRYRGALGLPTLDARPEIIAAHQRYDRLAPDAEVGRANALAAARLTAAVAADGRASRRPRRGARAEVEAAAAACRAEFASDSSAEPNLGRRASMRWALPRGRP